jgi:hypothetical protein
MLKVGEWAEVGGGVGETTTKQTQAAYILSLRDGNMSKVRFTKK